MIDEKISRSTIAIFGRASKLTARGLAYALGEAARKIRKAQAPQGKQTVKQLLRHGGEASPRAVSLLARTEIAMVLREISSSIIQTPPFLRLWPV